MRNIWTDGCLWFTMEELKGKRSLVAMLYNDEIRPRLKEIILAFIRGFLFKVYFAEVRTIALFVNLHRGMFSAKDPLRFFRKIIV